MTSMDVQTYFLGSESFTIIYKITNLINGKIYIGQTTMSLQKRWKAHRKKGSNCVALARAIQKYGKQNFKVEQIDVACDLDELNYKEEYYIRLYDCIAPKGYNLCAGGKNRIASDITRKRISEHHADVSGEHNPMYGTKRPEVGERNKQLKSKPVRCVETGAVYKSTRDACRALGKMNLKISAVCKGTAHTTGGYHWEYVQN